MGTATFTNLGPMTGPHDTMPPFVDSLRARTDGLFDYHCANESDQVLTADECLQRWPQFADGISQAIRFFQ